MNKRIEREMQTIEAMLRIYCQDKHGQNLCVSCQQLLVYAHKRLQNCPFSENKPACNHCKVHCYSEMRRNQVREVMRYAGPKMLFNHPLLALGHLIDTTRKVPRTLKK